jgi:UDPglucose 6-dehydrogenase
MRIAVVGSGYVGLVAGACFADLGHDVILVDNDERKLSASTTDKFPSTRTFSPNF